MPNAERLVAAIGLNVAPVILPERAAFHASVGEGKTAQEVDVNSKAAADVAQVWQWVGNQVGMQTLKQVKKKDSRPSKRTAA